MARSRPCTRRLVADSDNTLTLAISASNPLSLPWALDKFLPQLGAAAEAQLRVLPGDAGSRRRGRPRRGAGSRRRARRASLAAGPRLARGGRPARPVATVLDAWLHFDASNGDHVVVLPGCRARSSGCSSALALGLAGAVMQGVTRNPLADPGILGVNAGAALAVVVGIAVFGVGSVSRLRLVRARRRGRRGRRRLRRGEPGPRGCDAGEAGARGGGDERRARSSTTARCWSPAGRPSTATASGRWARVAGRDCGRDPRCSRSSWSARSSPLATGRC